MHLNRRAGQRCRQQDRREILRGGIPGDFDRSAFDGASHMDWRISLVGCAVCSDPLKSNREVLHRPPQQGRPAGDFSIVRGSRTDACHKSKSRSRFSAQDHVRRFPQFPGPRDASVAIVPVNCHADLCECIRSCASVIAQKRPSKCAFTLSQGRAK